MTRTLARTFLILGAILLLGPLAARAQFTPTVTGPINCGQTLQGNLDPSDTDFYGDGSFAEIWSLDLKQSAQLTVRMQFQRATASEPYVDILDANGASLIQGTPPRSIFLPTGSYFIVANNFSPLPAGDYPYDLSLDCKTVNLAPIFCGDTIQGALSDTDTDFFGDGTFADLYTVTITEATQLTLNLSPAGGGFTPYLQINNPQGDSLFASASGTLTCVLLPGNYIVIANNFNLLPPGSYPYDLSLACTPFADIPKPTISCNSTADGQLEPGDINYFIGGSYSDFFAFSVAELTRVSITVSPLPTGDEFNPFIRVFSGDFLAFFPSLDAFDQPSEGLILPGTYLIGVSALNPQGASFPYQVTIKCTGPNFLREFWEDPLDITQDDNDGKSGHALAVNLDGKPHPTLSVASGAPEAVVDGVRADSSNGERIIVGQSGIAWGGYSAAGTSGGSAHNITVMNIEDVFNPVNAPPNPPVEQYFRNAFLSFGQLNTLSAGDFPAPYDASNGSYIYTIFSQAKPGAGLAPAVGLAGGGSLSVSLSCNQSALGGDAPHTQSFRFLIQCAGARWYRSNPLLADNVVMFDDPFGGANSDLLTPDVRDSQLMDSFRVNPGGADNGLVWERIDPAAEASMNDFVDGNELPLGPTQGAPMSFDQMSAELSAVTGFGVVIDQLTGGRNIGGIPNSVAVLGLGIDRLEVPVNDTCALAPDLAAVMQPVSREELLAENGACAGHADVFSYYVFNPAPLDTTRASSRLQPSSLQNDDPILPCGPDNQGSHSVWYYFNPPQDGFINIDTIGSDYDTVVAVWDASAGGDRAEQCANLRASLACNDDRFAGGGAPTLESQITGLCVTAGSPILIEVADFDADTDGTGPDTAGPGGFLDFNFTFVPASEGVQILPTNAACQVFTGACQAPDPFPALEATDPDYFGDCTRSDIYLISVPSEQDVTITVRPTEACFDRFVLILPRDADRIEASALLTCGGDDSVTVPLAPGDYFVIVNNVDPLAERLPYTIEVGTSGLSTIGCGQTATGSLDSASDQDFFGDGTLTDFYCFSLEDPAIVTFQIDFSDSTVAPYLEVLNSAFSVSFGSTSGLGTLTLALQRGQYVILANNLLPLPAGSYPYSLSLQCAAPPPIACNETLNGSLEPTDPPFFGGQALGDVYSISLAADTDAAISLVSLNQNFSAYLVFFDADLNRIAEGFDSLSGNLAAGNYYVAAVGVMPDFSGPPLDYALTFACGVGAAPVVVNDVFSGGDPHGWQGGSLLGAGAVSTNGGLCMAVPAEGDNLVGYISPENYVELVDMSAYRVRLQMTTTQSAPGGIPLWMFRYDNYHADGTGNTYGGAQWFLDVDGGANGIGRANGRGEFEVWFAPNAMSTDQWRGVVDPGKDAFSASADAMNDMRLGVHLLDFGSDGYGANADAGTICVEAIQVVRFPMDALTVDSAVYNAPIGSGTHAAQTWSQADEGAGFAQIDDGAGVASYALAGPDNRKTLLPASPPYGLADLYPVAWGTNELYLGVLSIRSNVAGAVEGVDPVDAIFVDFDTANSELGAMHFTTRGAPDDMHLAASPRLASTTGGAQRYYGFFFTNNATASATPGARGLRLLGDFINAAQVGQDGQGSDPFVVESMEVFKLNQP